MATEISLNYHPGQQVAFKSDDFGEILLKGSIEIINIELQVGYECVTYGIYVSEPPQGLPKARGLHTVKKSHIHGTDLSVCITAVVPLNRFSLRNLFRKF